MGAYNTLEAMIVCEKCQKLYESRLQFKAGEIWLNKYLVGDIIKVDPSDKKIENLSIVVDAILEDDSCPSCRYSNFTDYDIFIERCKIVGFEKQTEASRKLHFDTFNVTSRDYYVES